MTNRRFCGGVRATVASGLAASFLLLGAAPALAGSAARTRPGGGAGGGSAAHAPAPGVSRPAPAAPTPVSGRATYGYGHGGGYAGAPWYPYYGSPYWYGFGGYGWGGWGWDGWLAPRFSVGLWWPPPGYGPEVLTASGEPRDEFAVIETDVRPRKTTVRLDGEEVGRAKDYNGNWDRLVVAPGRHLLEFSADGYLTLRTVVRAEPGRSYRIAQDLRTGEGIDPRSAANPTPAPADDRELREPGPTGAEPALRKGFLRIAADPPDAAVYLDGQFLASARELGALHGAIPVAQGEHDVEVIHPKYRARSLRVTVSGEEPVQVDLRLGPPSPN